jgi:outer membrane receptor for monomeric catechols
MKPRAGRQNWQASGVAAGEVRSRGFDLNVAGNLTPD